MFRFKSMNVENFKKTKPQKFNHRALVRQIRTIKRHLKSLMYGNTEKREHSGDEEQWRNDSGVPTKKEGGEKKCNRDSSFDLFRS